MKVLPQVKGVPVHLPSFRTSHSPPGLYNDCKGNEAHGPLQRTQNSPIPERLADQVPVSGRSPSEHSGSGRPNPVLGLDNKSGKIRTETYSGVLVRGLRIPSRFSPCKTHSREMAQTSGFDPTTQVKTCFDCKMFDVANWVACLNGEDGPGGTPSHEALSVSSQGALEISSVAGQPPSLDRCHFCTPRLVAESCKRDERLRPSSQIHSIQLFTDASNEGWGAHLDQSSTKGLWSDQEKRLHINVLELKAVSLALRNFKDQCQSQTVLVAADNSTVVAYINKQGGTHSVEMCALLWKIMTWCHRYHITCQTHSRVSECDGRPPVQVQPSAVNRMVTASTGVQTDLPEVVHSSCRPVCQSSEPQTPSVHVSNSRPKGLGHRCSEHKLDGSHCLCLPSNGSPSQGDPKNQAMPLPNHSNSPRLARDALVLGPSAALNRDPTTTPGVNDSNQTVPQVCVPQQSTTSQPPHLVSRSGQLQEQGFSV